MILGRYKQRPGEKRKRGVDYTRFLEVGEEISTVTAVVTPTTTPAFLINGIVIDAAKKKFAFFAENGLADTEYKVTFTVTTNNTQRKKDVIEFSVED
jgi:hypothetical protein